jgi:hypothetical protein
MEARAAFSLRASASVMGEGRVREVRRLAIPVEWRILAACSRVGD